MEQDDDENVYIEQEASLLTGKELGTLKNIEQKLTSLAEGTNVFVTYLHSGVASTWSVVMLFECRRRELARGVLPRKFFEF